MSIRAQIIDTLRADATLVGLLPMGTAGVINESDYREGDRTLKTPVLVVHYLGPHPHQTIPEYDVEAWEIRCFDRGEAYYNIEIILERVRGVLHRKQLDVNAEGTSAGMEIMYGWRTRSGLSRTFREEGEAIVFFVPVLHST